MKQRKVTRRNPVARELSNPALRPRIVKSAVSKQRSHRPGRNEILRRAAD